MSRFAATCGASACVASAASDSASQAPPGAARRTVGGHFSRREHADALTQVGVHSHAGSDPVVRVAARLDTELPDIDWAAVPDGVVRDTVEAPSGRLARVSIGPIRGPRVVLVPGATGSKEDFTLMLPLLAQAGYRVESYDLAGQYESADAGPEHLDPPQPHYTFELFVDDLLAVLAAPSAAAHDAGDERAAVHLLGYSFAGTLTAWLTAKHPELVASLTLLSTPPLPGQSFRGLKAFGPLSRVTNGHVGASLMIWGVRNNLNGMPPNRVRFVRDRFALTRRTSVDDIIGLMRQTPDLRDELRASSIPKLVATGTGDLWPVATHRRFAESIGASFRVYPTGHSPCETAPHQLVEDMIALFERRGLLAQ